MKTLYQVLNPEGKILGTGEDARGIAKWVEDYVLILDDHAKYSVATYAESSLEPGVGRLAMQNPVEDFVKQVKEAFA